MAKRKSYDRSAQYRSWPTAVL